MDENPYKSPERFQFSLYTLLLVVTSCAVVSGAFRIGGLAVLFTLVWAGIALYTVRDARGKEDAPSPDAILLAYVVALALFLVIFL